MPIVGSYATVGEVLNTFPPIGSVTTIDSAYIADAIGREEARVNAMLSRRYAVPFTDVPPVVQAAVTDLAVYRILSQRLFTQERMNNSDWPDRYKGMLDLIEMIAKGEANLITATGSEISQDTSDSVIWSDTKDFTPTMNEGPWERMFIDTDKPEFD